MECAVRRPVSAIRADTGGKSTSGSDKYQSGGYPCARRFNVEGIPHLQSCSDRCAHGAGGGVPRALGLRAASISFNDGGKESHAEPFGDTDNTKGQADESRTEDLHFCRAHCNPAGSASKWLGSFGANTAATRLDG